jgi:hypothetical protein
MVRENHKKRKGELNMSDINPNVTNDPKGGAANPTPGSAAGVNPSPDPAAGVNPSPKPEDNKPSDSEIIKENAELKIELRKQKKMIDEYSSQISVLKKQLTESLKVEGDKVTKQTEEMAEIKDKLEKAEKNILFRDTVESYMSLGMDKDYATKVAQMKMEGEEDLVNSSLKSFLDAERKRVKEEVTAELYAKMPAPISGNGDGQIDYEKQYNDRLAQGDVQGAVLAQLMAHPMLSPVAAPTN